MENGHQDDSPVRPSVNGADYEGARVEGKGTTNKGGEREMRVTIDIMQIIAVIVGFALCIHGSVSWLTFMLIVLFSFHAPIKIGE